MTDWLEQYSAALDIRDAREKAHKPYIDAYTKLADRTASAIATPSPHPTTDSPLPTPTSTSTSDSPSDIILLLRTSLATTQKARTTLQKDLSNLQTRLSNLCQTHKTTTTQLASLSREKVLLERKVKDREEELRAKGNLVQNSQDEMVALQLQLNLSEEKREKVERENEELVRRWMEKVRGEAEEVNRGSGWE